MYNDGVPRSAIELYSAMLPRQVGMRRCMGAHHGERERGRGEGEIKRGGAGTREGEEGEEGEKFLHI